MDRSHRTRRRGVPAVALAGILMLGGIAYAERFDYSLVGPGGSSATGRHWISLPETMTNPPIDDCCDLLAHVPNATNVGRWAEVTNTIQTCSCPGSPFAIVPGRSYMVQVSAASTFSIYGVDGGVTQTLEGPGIGSINGSQLMSLPFHRPAAIVDAFDLINDINAAAGSPAVVSVGRWETLTDTFTIYDGVTGSAFPLVSGVGYLVRMSFDVVYTTPQADQNFCTSLTSCTFRGLAVNALGIATLELNGSDNLVVSNLTSGTDGFQVLAPAGRTSHEEWIELGTWVQQPVNIGATTPDSSTRTVGLSTVARGASSFTLDVTEIAGDLVRVTPGLGPTGATLVRWEVYNGATRTGCVANQPLTATATATNWPNDFAQTVVKWPSPVTVTLPGGSNATGNELRLIPQNANVDVVDLSDMQVFVDLQGQPALSTITVTDVNFDVIPDDPSGSCGAPPAVVPAMSAVGLAASALLVLLAAGWLFRKRLV